jgi:hypothetical protein
MKQLKVSLNAKQRGALERAATKAGRSLSEEIRRRLSDSLARDQLDAFALVVGDEAAMIAQITLGIAFGQHRKVQGPNGFVLTDEQGQELPDEALKNLGFKIDRALLVAFNEWFGRIKFEKLLGRASETEIVWGHAAANGYSAARAKVIEAEQDNGDSEDEE